MLLVGSVCLVLLLGSGLLWLFLRRGGWSPWFRACVAAGTIALVATVAYALVPALPLPEGTRADAIRVFKSERRLELLNRGERVASYRISLGASPVGHKERENDERTPEGHYTITHKNKKSIAHLSLMTSYPEPADRRRARKAGIKKPGKHITIHGIKNGFGFVGRWHRLWDWTDGCMAVTDSEMDQIFGAVEQGTPIEILP